MQARSGMNTSVSGGSAILQADGSIPFAWMGGELEVHVSPNNSGDLGSGTLKIEESVNGGDDWLPVNSNSAGDDLAITTTGAWTVRVGQGWASTNGTDGRSKLLRFTLSGSTSPDIKITWRPAS